MSKLSWMREATDDDIMSGRYSFDHVYDAFYTDFYHDVYYSYISQNTHYIQDLKSMERFERLGPQLYSGLFDSVTKQVLSAAIQHPNYHNVVDEVNRIKHM
jgi:hypothetical protein